MVRGAEEGERKFELGEMGKWGWEGGNLLGREGKGGVEEGEIDNCINIK